MVKNESLICYLEKLKQIEKVSLNLKDLARIFDQPEDKIKTTVSEMIKNKELEGEMKDELLLINNQQKDMVKTEAEWNLL